MNNILLQEGLRLINRYNNFDKKARSYGTEELLYPSEIHVIDAIGMQSEMTTTKLAKTLGITKGGISQITAKLIKKGLIKKSKGSGLNEIFLSLTDKGKTAYEGHCRLHEDLLKRLDNLLDETNEPLSWIKWRRIMLFETIGNKDNPVVLMLNGSFSTGKVLSGVADKIADSYYVILPTYDGHHENGGIFTTREDQAKKIIDYLTDNSIDHITLLQGVSMGAEIALTLFPMLRENKIEVEHCLFDGGPFYHFPWLMRMFMRAKFRRLVHQAQTGTLDEITERFSNNKMVKWMIHGDISPYKWFIEALADSAPYMSDESVNNESDACYTFCFPALSEEAQRKAVFIWSTNEPAFTSFKNVRKCYSHSRFASPGDLGHCGFMARKPDEYAALMRSYAEGSYDRLDKYIEDLT